MTFVAVAIGGSALLGYMGSQRQASAAESASNLQYQATQDAARQQREMFNILNAQQAPYRQAGYGALNRISTLLGTGQPSAVAGGGGGGGGGGFFGGIAGQIADQIAQSGAIGGAAAPGLTVDTTSPEYGTFTRMFRPSDLTANLAPNYEFMKQQGLGAVSQAGNVSSPGSNVDLARTMFAEKFAQNAYQDALNNWRNQQTDIYNRLSNLAGIGQTSQGQAQQLGTGTASNIAQLGLGGASALGAGQIASAGAQAGGLQGIGNAGMLYSFLRPQTGGSSIGYGSGYAGEGPIGYAP